MKCYLSHGMKIKLKIKRITMLKKTFLLMSIFTIFLFVSSPVKAQSVDMNEEYGKTCTLRKCEVPIPTLIAPDKASFSGKKDIYLTGLTWNNTKIQVYLDAQYQGEAVVQKDDSDIGNFYYKLNANTVDKGSHRWSVIATSGYSRSFVSKENTFYVSSNTVKPVLPKSEEKHVESIKNNIKVLENASSTTSSTEIIIEPVSTTTNDLEIGKEATSTDQASTSTESILQPENIATTTEVIIVEPVQELIKEKTENVVNIETTKETPETHVNGDSTEKTSAIKENKDGVVISSVESPRGVSVYEKSESDVDINVAKNSEGKSLVVDNNYKPSESQPSIESEKKESGIAETLQNAKVSGSFLDKVKEELGFNSEIEKQKKNRIIGISILSFVVVLYVIVSIVRKKDKK